LFSSAEGDFVAAHGDALVSVLTPAFNAAPYLAETIQSCLAQTYPHFELLIVDDGSTDDTAGIAQSYARSDPRVRVFSTPNGGVSAARNTAIASASGTYIALLDSDDVWMPDYLEAQVRTLSLNPDVDIVTANAINIGGRCDGLPYWPLAEPREITLREMIVREDAVHIFSVFRRTVLDRVGGFDPAFRGNEDYYFWLRAAAAGCRFFADFVPRGYYRRHPDSMSANEQRMLKGILRVYHAIRPLYPSGSPEANAIDTQVARFSRRLVVSEARECILTGDPRSACTLLKQIPAKDRGRRLSAVLRVAGFWPSVLSLGYRTKQALRQ
jgi:glycosyltransferase involved in cell wall biosynthesis